jgi:hypothetical protein
MNLAAATQVTDQRRSTSITSCRGRRLIAPPRMQNAGDYLTDVGFRPEGDAVVRDLA